MNNALKYWPVFIVAMATAIAWGSQQSDITNLKEVQIQQQLNINEFQNLSTRQARIDERTKAIKENQQRQEQLLQTILDKLQ